MRRTIAMANIAKVILFAIIAVIALAAIDDILVIMLGILDGFYEFGKAYYYAMRTGA